MSQQFVKIENYDVEPLNPFTFPYNPQSISQSTNTYNEITAVPFSNFNFMLGNRAVQAKEISFTGHFTLANKDSQYEEVASRLSDGSKLLKLFLRDDRFLIVGGASMQKTNLSDRTNFTDYVFGAVAFYGRAFGSELKQATFNGSSWTNGNLTNQGGDYTYIEEVVITLSGTSGQTIILNSAGRSGITIRLNRSYSAGSVLTLKLVRYEDIANVFSTKFWEVRDSLNRGVPRSRSSTKKELALSLEKGARIDSTSISGTAQITNVVFRFRDGYVMG